MTDTPALTEPSIRTARALNWPKQPPALLVAALKHVAADTGKSPTMRSNALAAVPDGLNSLDEAQFGLVRDASWDGSSRRATFLGC